MSEKRSDSKSPQDRKPSVKRTLEDVQQSLSDIINNELAELSGWEHKLFGKKQAANETPNVIINRKSNEVSETVIAQKSTRAEDKSVQKKSGATGRQTHPDTMDEKLLDPDNFTLEIQPAMAPSKKGTGSNAGLKKPGPDNIPPAPDFEDDIPVLRDVAAPPPPEEDEDEELPESGQAREIAVRVVAKLNIELKNKGKPPLDPTLVNRIQALLRKELEQQAKNLDNMDDE